MDHSSKVALKIRGIKKAFGDKLVHDGVEFDLYENEVLGLFGTSGSGKSVILRSIIGLENIYLNYIKVFAQREKKFLPGKIWHWACFAYKKERA